MMREPGYIFKDACNLVKGSVKMRCWIRNFKKFLAERRNRMRIVIDGHSGIYSFIEYSLSIMKFLDIIQVL